MGDGHARFSLDAVTKGQSMRAKGTRTASQARKPRAVEPATWAAKRQGTSNPAPPATTTD